MYRFYVNKPTTGNTFFITERQHVHHIKDVLRLKPGEAVIIFDSSGNEFECTIQKIEKEQVLLSSTTTRHTPRKKTKLTIACAIPKHGKMDDIIDHLTQLGTDTIIPLMTQRTIVKLDEEKKVSRTEHWRKIAQNAAQQSQRNDIPVISTITTFSDLVQQAAEYDLKLIPTLSGERKNLKEVLSQVNPSNILVAIGPEGDFTPREIEEVKQAGFVPVSLGDSVLRVGTAALAVASYIQLSCTY